MTTPVAGAHYPRSTGEFLSWYGTDDDCLDYLEWLRWPGGFVCPDCGHAGGWRLGDGRVKCGGCGSRTSVTAGTIFDKTRTPLTVWFHACWLFATAKDGISAQHLQRVLEISSYQTAWAMLHRLRSALVRPGRDRLSGTVEVDETYIGGEEPGLRGGRQRGKKVLTGIAVEVREPKGIGRCRMAPLDDASGDTLGTFVTENVQPGATVITDGWAAYRAISGKGYQHRPINQKAARAAGEDPDSLLPGVHRVASLCKRWLLGTHQGSVDAAHLPAYLNEFVFRFNRRRSASRGMVFYRVLQLAAGHEPVRYVDLLASKKPRRAKRAEGGTGHPPSLERPAADRPWRTAEIQLQFPVRLSGYPRAGYDTRRAYLYSQPICDLGQQSRLADSWLTDHQQRTARVRSHVFQDGIDLVLAPGEVPATLVAEFLMKPILLVTRRHRSSGLVQFVEDHPGQLCIDVFAHAVNMAGRRAPGLRVPRRPVLADCLVAETAPKPVTEHPKRVERLLVRFAVDEVAVRAGTGVLRDPVYFPPEDKGSAAKNRILRDPVGALLLGDRSSQEPEHSLLDRLLGCRTEQSRPHSSLLLGPRVTRPIQPSPGLQDEHRRHRVVVLDVPAAEKARLILG